MLCGVLSGTVWCGWWPTFPLAKLERFIVDLGPWGVAASIGLMIVHSLVPFPAEFLAIANGVVFGPYWGTLITWTGAMLGALFAFGLARGLGRPFVMKVLSAEHTRSLDAGVARLGPDALLIGRFIPVISFNLMNYAAGLTSVSWWTFAWTTGVGILPLTVFMVLLGDRLDSASWQLWLVVFAAAGLVWYAAHLVLRARKRPNA